jgi:glycosyltransferase involved in cell wall biosynthesis
MTAPPSSHPRIRVAVNALHAKSGGGITYLVNIIPRLAADERLDLHLILMENQVGLFGPADPRIRVHVVPSMHGLIRLTAWEQLALPGLARRLGADVLFTPGNYGCFLFPRNVILLRNAVAVAKGEPRLAMKVYWTALSAATWLSAATAKRVIAVSEYALRSLTRGLTSWIERKSHVIAHGIDPRFSANPAVPREDFILVVADIYIQKNLVNLARAVGIVHARHPEVCVRIAGAPVDTWYYEQVRSETRKLGLEANVEFLGRQTPDALLALYRRCRFLVFPSTAETFGHPLVEAMACATPVACSDAAAMPEVVGDAALMFDPYSPEAIAGAMERLIASPELRAELATKGLARSRLFSWERTGKAAADVLVAAAER